MERNSKKKGSRNSGIPVYNKNKIIKINKNIKYIKNNHTNDSPSGNISQYDSERKIPVSFSVTEGSYFSFKKNCKSLGMNPSSFIDRHVRQLSVRLEEAIAEANPDDPITLLSKEEEAQAIKEAIGSRVSPIIYAKTKRIQEKKMTDEEQKNRDSYFIAVKLIMPEIKEDDAKMAEIVKTVLEYGETGRTFLRRELKLPSKLVEIYANYEGPKPQYS